MRVGPDYIGPYAKELNEAIAIADEAAEIVLRFYEAQSAGTYEKADGSPVTDADIASDAHINQRLQDSFPDDARLTEETASDLSRLLKERVWIVDPIDGTAQFIAHNGLFDILIALTVNHEVVLGVSLQPATGLMHAAVRDAGAWRRADGAWERFSIAPTSASPRLRTSIYYDGYPRTDESAAVAAKLGGAAPETLTVGYSIRAMDPTQRTYDGFIGWPQPPGTSAAHEWDLATPDIITTEAGGAFTDMFGRRHRYNKHNNHISGGILVSDSPEMQARLLAALKEYLPTTLPAQDPAEDGAD